MDPIGKVILAGSFKAVLDKFSELIKTREVKQQERERLSAALKSIQIASIRTRTFINSKGYEPNEELSGLWTDALEKCLNAGVDDLPEFLFQKARFWGNPQGWLNEKQTLKLVPKLNYLDEKCEMLLIELRK